MGREKGISREMSVAVKKQVLQRMSHKKPLQMGDVQALPMLSLTLRENLKFELCKDHIRSHQLFRLVEQTDHSVLKCICKTGIVFRALLPQDVLFVQDTPCSHAYLVTNGVIEYREKVTAVLTGTASGGAADETQFVERDWLSWAALWCHWTHVGKAEAGPVCEVLMLNSDALERSVSRSHMLRQFFEEYSFAFHKRLVEASPVSAGTWPDDLQVPLTDYGEIVLGMPQFEQNFVGLKVLERMESQYSLPWRGMSEKRIHELEKEVGSGRCVLIENKEGGAERVVSFTGLHMETSCGKVLVVLAKKGLDSDGELEPEGQLPGVKQHQGELPNQALRRMMREQLRPFAKAVRVHSFRREDRHENSARYKIKTNYIRVIYSASLPETFTSSLCERSPRNRLPRQLSKQERPLQKWTMPEAHACHILQDSCDVYVCAFMDPECLEFFRKSSGRKQLTQWVHNITVNI